MSKNFKTRLNAMITDEKIAPKDYSKLIAVAPNQEIRKKLMTIPADEKKHYRILQGIKKNYRGSNGGKVGAYGYTAPKMDKFEKSLYKSYVGKSYKGGKVSNKEKNKGNSLVFSGNTFSRYK